MRPFCTLSPLSDGGTELLLCNIANIILIWLLNLSTFGYLYQTSEHCFSGSIQISGEKRPQFTSTTAMISPEGLILGGPNLTSGTSTFLRWLDVRDLARLWPGLTLPSLDCPHSPLSGSWMLGNFPNLGLANTGSGLSSPDGQLSLWSNGSLLVLPGEWPSSAIFCTSVGIYFTSPGPNNGQLTCTLMCLNAASQLSRSGTVVSHIYSTLFSQGVVERMVERQHWKRGRVNDSFNVWNHGHSQFRQTRPPFPSVSINEAGVMKCLA